MTQQMFIAFKEVVKVEVVKDTNLNVEDKETKLQKETSAVDAFILVVKSTL